MSKFSDVTTKKDNQEVDKRVWEIIHGAHGRC